MKKQKFFASTLTAAMVATVIVPVASAQQAEEVTGTFDDFSEVSSWAKEAVTYLKDIKIIEGYNNLFMPKQELTRGEAAKMIAVSLGLAPETTGTTFPDLTGHWSEGYVSAIVNSTEYADVIDGTDTGTFEPNRAVTREELAKMIALAFDLTLDETKEVSFTDNDSWGKEYVDILASNGIVNGVGDNKFAPTRDITREEAAVYFYRVLKEEARLEVAEKVPTELTLVNATVVGNDNVTFENNTFTMTQGESITSIIFEMNQKVEELEKELTVYLVNGDQKVAYGTVSVEDGKLVVTPFENNEKAGLTGTFTFEVEGLETIKSVSGLTFGEDFKLPTLVVENNDLTVTNVVVNGDENVKFDGNKFTMTQGESIESITFEMNEKLATLEKDLVVNIVKGDQKVAYGTLKVVDGKAVVTPLENNGTAGLTGTFTFEVEGLDTLKSLDGSVLGKDITLPTLEVANNGVIIEGTEISGSDNAKVDEVANTITITQGEPLPTITFDTNEKVNDLTEGLEVTLVDKEGNEVPYGTLTVEDGKVVITPSTDSDTSKLGGDYTIKVEGLENITTADGSKVGEDFNLPTIIVENNDLTLKGATVQGNDNVKFDGNTFTITQGESITSITFDMNEDVKDLTQPLTVNIVNGNETIPYGTLTVENGDLVLIPSENKGTAGLVGDFTFEVEGIETIESIDGSKLVEGFELPSLEVVNNELEIDSVKVHDNNNTQYDSNNNVLTVNQFEHLEYIIIDMNEDIEVTQPITVAVMSDTILGDDTQSAYATLYVDKGKLVLHLHTFGYATVSGELNFEVAENDLDKIKSKDGSELPDNFKLPTVHVIKK